MWHFISMQLCRTSTPRFLWQCLEAWSGCRKDIIHRPSAAGSLPIEAICDELARLKAMQLVFRLHCTSTLSIVGSLSLNFAKRASACSARFAEAALQAAAACAEQYSQGKSTDTWCKLAAQAVSQLMAACKSQSDPKKTFKTVVTRLLVPILIMNPRKGEWLCQADPHTLCVCTPSKASHSAAMP